MTENVATENLRDLNLRILRFLHKTDRQFFSFISSFNISPLQFVMVYVLPLLYDASASVINVQIVR